MSTQEATKRRTHSGISAPRRYNVIMHNDDFTTMEFVVEILKTIFRKSSAEAENLMLTVHRSGQAVVGCYSYDIAVSKTEAAIARARAAGFPFRMTVEEA